jgi:hypothetical protein
MRRLGCILLALGAPLIAETISGTVINGVTHEPVSGASVTVILGQRLFGRGNDVRTDASGAFRLENVPPGDHLVLASHEGFEPPPFVRTAVRVEQGKDAGPLHLTMMPFPSLTGRVLDRDHRPVAKVAVSAIPSHGSTPWPVTTDSEGRFSFKSLPPSRYTLLANPLETNKDSGLAPAYYPNATERADSPRITVNPGPDLTGYDIVLPGGPVFRVSGRVVDEDGKPAPRATVRVRNADVLFARVTCDAEGAFAFENIPAMSGRLSAQWKRGDSELQGYSVMHIGHELENVVVRVAPPVALTGTVELDGKPLPQGPGFAVLEPVDGMAQRVQSTATERGFRFDDAYAGRYRLVFYPGGGSRSGYLDSILVGEQAVTTQPFDLAPGTPPVRVILKSGGGQVRGTVEDSEAELMTVLVPREERLRYLPFIVQSLAQGGRFQFEDVRPGDYYALTLQGLVWLMDLQDPAFLGPLLPRASAVHVDSGATATVKLKAP